MNYKIKMVGRIVADGIDLDTARVVLNNGIGLNVTYDRLQKNLIIHKWYKLNDSDHDMLRMELEKYFADNLSSGNGNAA